MLSQHSPGEHCFTAKVVVAGSWKNLHQVRGLVGPLNQPFAKESHSFLVGVDLRQDGRKPSGSFTLEGKVSLLVYEAAC